MTNVTMNASAPKACPARGVNLRSKLYDAAPISWQVSPGLTAYPQAAAAMEARAKEIAAGEARQQIWLVEHPPLYTAGTSAKPQDLTMPERFDVFQTGRGGQYTYHGPGQRVAYFMLDLRQRGRDVSAFVCGLEQVIIDTLCALGAEAGRREGRIGVWVTREDGREEKIAAIGVRLKKWVSFHGIAINVSPDLSHFSGIVPCGIREHGVASLSSLGCPAEMAEVDRALQNAVEAIFGPVTSSQ